MQKLRWTSVVTRMNKVKNNYTRGRLKAAPIYNKLRATGYPDSGT